MTEKHLLISRIVDRDDSPEDWATLDDLAGRDRNTWQDLLQSLRDDALVRQAVTGRLALADTVALPATSGRNGIPIGSLAFALSGWLAAAALVLVWWSGLFAEPAETGTDRPDGVAGRRGHSSGEGGSSVPGNAMQPGSRASRPAIPKGLMRLTANGPDGTGDGVVAKVETHVKDGDAVAELPSLLIEARQLPGTDKTEVLYVRRTLERAVVSDAYRMAVDDGGGPVAVPTDLKRYMPTRVY